MPLKKHNPMCFPFVASKRRRRSKHQILELIKPPVSVPPPSSQPRRHPGTSPCSLLLPIRQIPLDQKGPFLLIEGGDPAGSGGDSL